MAANHTGFYSDLSVIDNVDAALDRSTELLGLATDKIAQVQTGAATAAASAAQAQQQAIQANTYRNDAQTASTAAVKAAQDSSLNVQLSANNAATATTQAGLASTAALQAGNSATLAQTLTTFAQNGSGAVVRPMKDKLVGLEVDVEDFGAVGDAVTDDTAAFQRAINYVRNTRNGGVVRFSKRHLINSTLYVEDWVHLKGGLDTPGELRFDGTSDFNIKGSQLIVNPAATISIRSGSTVSNALVMRKGLVLPFADLAAAQAGVAAFAGTAFTTSGSDTSLHNLLVLGFNKILYSNNFERCRVDHVQGDCTNGIELLSVYDIAYVDRVHLWPFTTTHRPWTTGAINSRSGFGFRFANVGDWSKLTNCFTYGYAKGFTVEGCNFVNLIGCGTDGHGPDASTSIGFEIIGNSKMTTLIACQAAAQGYAIVVDNNPGGAASTAAVTKIQGCCFWDNDIKHVDVRSGRVVFNGNSIWRGVVGIDVNSAAQGIIDSNDFEDITGNAISSGSFDNLNIGPTNRFTNCTNNFGQRKVIEANGTDIIQLSRAASAGVALQPRRSRGTTASKAALAVNDQLYSLDPYGYDGTNFLSAGTLRQVVKNTPSANNLATAWVVATRGDSAASPTDRWVFAETGNLQPVTDNVVSLGASGARVSSIWSANGTIQTSDKRTKLDIKDSALGLDFVNILRPVSYRWKEGKQEVVRQVWLDSETGEEVPEGTEGAVPGKVETKGVEGERTHWGLIAQEVKEATDAAGVDFAGWVLSDKNDPESQQALRYDQFISPMIKAIQELSAEVEELKRKLNG